MISRIGTVAALIFAASTIGATSLAEENGPKGFAAHGFDTRMPVETTLDLLNGVREAGPSPRFDHIWSGVGPSGESVLVGENSGRVELLSFTVKGWFGTGDRRSIAAFENEWGLAHLERNAEDCDKETAAGLECVALHYACPQSAPECHIQVLSFGAAGLTGRTRISWVANPAFNVAPK